MSAEQNQFSPDDLKKIDDADDLHISPLREDGKTYGTPTWIWAVAVEGDLYVRAYNGVKSRWHQAAIKQKTGLIRAAGMIREVSFEPVQGALNKIIDEAYKKKYKSSPYLSSMISPRAEAATVRIIPG